VLEHGKGMRGESTRPGAWKDNIAGGNFRQNLGRPAAPQKGGDQAKESKEVKVQQKKGELGAHTDSPAAHGEGDAQGHLVRGRGNRATELIPGNFHFPLTKRTKGGEREFSAKPQQRPNVPRYHHGYKIR